MVSRISLSVHVSADAGLCLAEKPTGERVIDWLSRFSMRPGAIFLWVLPLVLLFVLVDPFGMTRPTLPEVVLRLVAVSPFRGLRIPDLGPRQNPAAILRHRRVALTVASVSLGMPLIVAGNESGSWQHGLSIFALLMTVAATLLVIHTGHPGVWIPLSEFQSPSPCYANEAVLPFYILHQPIILLIGYFVVPLALPIASIT